VLLLLTGSVVTAWGLPPRFLATLCAYLFLTVSYSVALKHRMLLDVITIATLFVLRAIAGAYAIDVPWSSWLLICTFMLCLFLGFGKRRCEIAMIGSSDAALLGHRRTLVRYTPDLLNQLLSTSGGIAIITFLLYTLSPESPDAPIHFGQRRGNLVYTLPLVVYGIFRYAMLIELGKATGPTDLLIKDPPFLAAILLWVLAATLILYGWPLPAKAREACAAGKTHLKHLRVTAYRPVSSFDCLWYQTRILVECRANRLATGRSPLFTSRPDLDREFCGTYRSHSGSISDRSTRGGK
jgi:4-hydroxybenzoate polyprenyltransferase